MFKLVSGTSEYSAEKARERKDKAAQRRKHPIQRRMQMIYGLIYQLLLQSVLIASSLPAKAAACGGDLHGCLSFSFFFPECCRLPSSLHLHCHTPSLLPPTLPPSTSSSKNCGKAVGRRPESAHVPYLEAVEEANRKSLPRSDSAATMADRQSGQERVKNLAYSSLTPSCVDSNIGGGGFFEMVLEQSGCSVKNGTIVPNSNTN
ncbi:hypothetical protein PIB30_041322 [Stylosanthes scabra]|uniref:Uncharacterized protein n=1 Tax=Stylosanthes scabra TaxID=79078 RepID=A0ABU6UGY3_9FABA|nr:hypothetical protein [Stylosanthes scabra]